MNLPPPELAPSILAANFARLGEEITAVLPYAGRIHVDVMDGHFVPNLSMGPATVRGIRPVTSKPIEVHLMVEVPASFVEAFTDAGADRIVFHVETESDAAGLAKRIRKLGPAAGIAIKPATPWSAAEPLLGEVDLVILMTVEPGFGGQQFLEEMLPKVSEAREAVRERGIDVDIEVDGGIDPETGGRARKAGANVFVAGNSIFGAKDPAAAAERIVRAIATEAGE